MFACANTRRYISIDATLDVCTLYTVDTIQMTIIGGILVEQVLCRICCEGQVLPDRKSMYSVSGSFPLFTGLKSC